MFRKNFAVLLLVTKKMFVQFVWGIFPKEPFYLDLEMLLHVYGSQTSEFSLKSRAATQTIADTPAQAAGINISHTSLNSSGPKPMVWTLRELTSYVASHLCPRRYG